MRGTQFVQSFEGGERWMDVDTLRGVSRGIKIFEVRRYFVRFAGKLCRILELDFLKDGFTRWIPEISNQYSIVNWIF